MSRSIASTTETPPPRSKISTGTIGPPETKRVAVAATGAELAADPVRARRLLADACCEAAERFHAKAVVPGGAALAGMAADIAEQVPVPPIDSIDAAATWAVACLRARAIARSRAELRCDLAQRLAGTLGAALNRCCGRFASALIDLAVRREKPLRGVADRRVRKMTTDQDPRPVAR